MWNHLGVTQGCLKYALLSDLRFSYRTHMVVGATINTYLLEKTRVAHQAEGEKRFHIFEQVRNKHREKLKC